jgi:hypothetical protein
MTRRALLLSIVLVFTVGGVAVSYGETDLANALIGKWEGSIMHFNRNNPNRTLVITSVDGASAKGKWGIPGRATWAVTIAVDASGGAPTLRFSDASGLPVRLTLQGRRLVGTVTQNSNSAPREWDLRLDRAD